MKNKNCDPPKQETVEEAAEIDLSLLCYYDKRNPDYSPYDEDYLTKTPSNCSCDNCFYGRSNLTEQLIKQKERMFSEEDMREAFLAGSDKECWTKVYLSDVVSGRDYVLEPIFENWFEQFKKKKL